MAKYAFQTAGGDVVTLDTAGANPAFKFVDALGNVVAIPASSGTGGLPTPTDADVGKTPVVQADKSYALATPSAKATSPSGFVRGTKTLLSTQSMVSDLFLAVGDTLTFQAVGAPSLTYTVQAGDTVQTLLTALANAPANTLVSGGLDNGGRLYAYTTTGVKLVIYGSSTSVMFSLFGTGETAGAVFIQAAANETDIRAKLLLGAEISKQTSKPVVLRIPPVALTFAFSWVIQKIHAPNLYVVGADITRTATTTAATTIPTATAAGTTGVSSNVVNVTLTNLTFSGGGIDFAVGDYVTVEPTVSTTSASNITAPWTLLGGFFKVTAVAANSLTLAIPYRSSGSSAGTALTGVPFTGTNSVSLSISKIGTVLTFPANVCGILLDESRIGGFARIGLVGQSTSIAQSYEQGAALFARGNSAHAALAHIGATGWGADAISAIDGGDISGGAWPTALAGVAHDGLYSSGNSACFGTNHGSRVSLSKASVVCAGGSSFGSLFVTGGDMTIPVKTIAGGGFGPAAYVQAGGRMQARNITSRTLRDNGNSDGSSGLMVANFGIIEAFGTTSNISTNVTPNSSPTAAGVLLR